MIIKQETFLSILGLPETSFAVPVFQRVYSWETRHCQELWDDIMAAGERGTGHFAGMLLFSPDQEASGETGQLNVIDGQQRLTTITLMLTALRNHLAAHPEAAGSADAPSAERIQETYLQVDGADGKTAKLQLSFLDGPTLCSLVEGAPLPEEHSNRLVENLQFFESRMQAADFSPTTLWRGLGLLQVITALLGAEDNPQLVFESLNAKGKGLSAADLLRNSLLYTVEKEEQERLYSSYWHPMEADLVAADVPDGMEKLLRAWLANRYRDSYVKNESDVFAVLKKHLSGKHRGSHERLLREIALYEKRYASDPDFRKKADKNAKDWLDGKSDGLVSKRKIFGD